MFNFIRNILRKNIDSKKILIISFKYLGDTIFTFPAIQRLIESYPNYEINILCSESNKTLYEIYFTSFRYIIIERDKIKLEKNFSFSVDFFKACFYGRKISPEITFDVTSSFKSSIMTVFSGARILIGFGNHRLKFLFDIFDVKSNNVNMINMFLRPLEKLSRKNIIKDDTISYNQITFSYQTKKIKRILLHPFAGWSAKEWGIKKYLQLAEMLNKEFQVLIISEKNKLSKDIIDEFNNSLVDYKTTSSISQLIAEIKNCDLFIGNDSGPLMISNLLQKPVFAIFGPTNPQFHTPLFDLPYRFINENLICSPGISQKLCFTFGGRLGCPSYECMNMLTLNKVYSSIIKFISDISLSR